MQANDSKRNFSLSAVALLVGLFACGMANAQQQQFQQAAGGLQTIQVMDPQVGLPALSIALPQGWTHQFQSIWNKNSDPMVMFEFEAREPRGAGRFYISWSINFYDMPQYYGKTAFFQKLMPPRQAFEYMQNLARQSDPAFRAKGYRVVQSQDFPPADMNGGRMFNSILWADYTENGVPMQELLNVMVVTAPPGISWTLVWNGLSDRKGVPREALASRLDTISQSVLILPQWLQKKAAVLAQWGNENEARAALALANSNAIREASLNATKQNQATLEHVLQSNRERDQARNASRDRVNAGAIDAIKNENVYRDSSGRTFTDSNNPKHIWTNSSNDRRIYSDDSTYNPSADKGVNDVQWGEAQRVPR
jgi:hypothetical protein